MRIYQFTDFRAFVREEIALLPKKGRGAYKQLAKHLEVNPSFINQVFLGPKNLSQEQAYLVAEFLGLSPHETKYFSILLELARSENVRFRNYLLDQLANLRKGHTSTIPTQEHRLDEVSKMIFYSAWYYSAIHLMTTIPSFETVTALSEALKLPPSLVKGVLNFLVTSGLCGSKNGRYFARIMSTNVEGEPHYSIAHNINWRNKAVERLPSRRKDDLFHTNVISIGTQDIQTLRTLLKEKMSQFQTVVKKSPAQQIFCFNLDFFEL